MKRWCALAASCVLLAATNTSAVIVKGGPVEAPPSPDPGFTHLAVVAGLSGVYLGEGWVLTARHVVMVAKNEKKSDVLLDGHTYALRPETAVLLANAGQKADLALVKIDGSPELPALEIATRTPPVGTPLLLIGNGPLQETKERCWSPAGLETAATTPGARCGFLWRKTPEGKTNGVQWGTSQVSIPGADSPGPEGVRTRVFGTIFREAGATPHEAQAGVGDSGGPVFALRGKTWELAGVMLGVSVQSPSAALYGDRTYVADLSVYRDAIERALHPE